MLYLELWPLQFSKKRCAQKGELSHDDNKAVTGKLKDAHTPAIFASPNTCASKQYHTILSKLCCSKERKE